MTGQGTTDVDVVSKTPECLLSHTVEQIFDMQLMTPDDFTKAHTADDVNFDELCSNFREFIPDFGQNIIRGQGQMSIFFTAKILFEVGPESRKVKRGSGDKTWKFNIRNEQNVITKAVYVATFKSKNSYTKTANTQVLVLTIKLATLLASVTFGQLIKFAINEDKILMTPLAGAIFSRVDIKELHEKLLQYKSDLTIADVVITINTSCIPGGQYLPTSTAHCAAVCSIVATTNMKDQTLRSSIISKTVRQYLAAGKTLDKVLFGIYAQFANGGIPNGLEPDTLLELFTESRKISKLEQKKTLDSSVRTSTVQVPGFSGGEKKLG
nr:MAG: putative N protein [Phasmaviridae sp.]